MGRVAFNFLLVVISSFALINAAPGEMGWPLAFTALTLFLCMVEPVQYIRLERKYLAEGNVHAIDALPELKKRKSKAKTFGRLVRWTVILVLVFTGLNGLLSKQGFDTSPGMLVFALSFITLGGVYKSYLKGITNRIDLLTGQAADQIEKAMSGEWIKSLPEEELGKLGGMRFRYFAYLFGEIGGIWGLLSIATGDTMAITDALFILVASLTYLGTAPLFNSAYRARIKRRFFPELVEKYGLEYSNQKLFDMDELFDHGIVHTYRKQVVDDAFSGTINGRKIEVQEFLLSEFEPDEARAMAKNENWQRWLFYTLLTPLFKVMDKLKVESLGEKGLYRGATFAIAQRGVAVRIPLNKKLYCHTLVFSKGLLGQMKEKFPKYKSVGLLNDKLNKHFDVFANDQVESRYIFDPAFMERFAELIHRLPMADVEASFKNQELVMLCLQDHDSFEAGGLYSGLKRENFEPMIRQIETYTDIVKLLELDPDRGL